MKSKNASKKASGRNSKLFGKIRNLTDIVTEAGYVRRLSEFGRKVRKAILPVSRLLQAWQLSAAQGTAKA